MKTQTNASAPAIGAQIEPFAVATCGEQARDSAYDQIAKFQPRGANYRRLLALQDAGDALVKSPTVYAAAPELLAALYAALPFIEDAIDSADFKPGFVRGRAQMVRAAISKAECAQ